ncbi:hypothetical protein PRIPAC_96263 [Pristionchus pacificus]|uniref:Uncharacterized protein n=1 Tax=Pristionchus pacificus TaxID=54126 RepID=A0A2A6BCH8_PRIPA|nr:hypothetical protein PRIPAC_96263 [Pristionchus pacificus]|eukprot:PDM63575.1 hypothetical protein PRIPAC_49548 [Pristionchus pacificus]
MASLFCDSDNESSEIFLGQTRQENRSQSTMVADVMARNNENQNGEQIYPAPSHSSHSMLSKTID